MTRRLESKANGGMMNPTRFILVGAALLGLAALGCGEPDTRLELMPRVQRITGNMPLAKYNPVRQRQSALNGSGAHVIFLNFDGGRLTLGFDDSTQNVTQIL